MSPMLAERLTTGFSMLLRAIHEKLRSELEAPQEARRFGTGWIAGCLALLAATSGLSMVVALRHPALFTMPELKTVRESIWFQPGVHVVLVIAYLLAALSLVLRPQKVLGISAMAITLFAAFLGSLPVETLPGEGTGVFLGLDFFVLNVLFIGFLFVPLEHFFPQQGEQSLFREEWREDL